MQLHTFFVVFPLSLIKTSPKSKHKLFARLLNSKAVELHWKIGGVTIDSRQFLRSDS
jgi:hypothetical protein